MPEPEKSIEEMLYALPVLTVFWAFGKVHITPYAGKEVEGTSFEEALRALWNKLHPAPEPVKSLGQIAFEVFYLGSADPAKAWAVMPCGSQQLWENVAEAVLAASLRHQERVAK